MNADERSVGSQKVERLHRAFGDVRALGAGAPLRAGYEASKRLGGHTLVFRHMVPTAAETVEGQSPFVFGDVPAAVRSRTIAAADRIVDGRIELFGRDLDLGDPPDWHAVIHTTGSWPSNEWWKIDLRSDQRIGDVKWVWELGRHRHLVALARAASLEPSDGRYRETLERQLDSWIEANPPEIGVHWYSNLELSLRAIAWLQILALTGDQMAPELRSAMWSHLRHTGRHLIADLPYTVSTMRNNHLLGDALGLIALGSAFGGRTGDRWRRIGDRIFEGQLRRHMRPDGSMIEDSLSYHRFVLEMLSMRCILGGATTDVYEAMEDAAQFLARLGVLDGPVPQYGDWDEGRVFAVAENPSDVRGSVRLGLALAGSGAPQDWREANDELAWFSGDGVPASPDEAETSGRDLGAGIGRVVGGPLTVWLKGGSAPSHGHADLSSVAIALGGEWLVGDPGTGTYNGPIDERNSFRSSDSHNVLRVNGEDQLVPHRAFRWVHEATGTIGDPVHFGKATVMWTVHDAFARLAPPRRVVRVVVADPDGVEVIDHVEGPPTSSKLALPLGPTTTWDAGHSTIEGGGGSFHLELPAGETAAWRGSDDPYAGWWSETYGTATPTTVLEARCSPSTSFRWAIRPAGGDKGGRVPGSGVVATSVAFDGDQVRLRVEADGRTYLRGM